MSKTNHHKRKDYEAQYIKLYKEDLFGFPSLEIRVERMRQAIKKLSDYQLLLITSHLLLRFNCTPFTNVELERKLV